MSLTPELTFNSLAEFSRLNSFLENDHMSKSSEGNSKLVNEAHGLNIAYEQRSTEQSPMCDRNRAQIMKWKLHAQTVFIQPKEGKGKEKIPKKWTNGMYDDVI